MALALAVRLVYLLEQGMTSPLFYQPLLDELELVESARALLAGQGFGNEPLFKGPAYPLILAAVMAVTGETWPWSIRLLQHLGGVLLVWLAFDAARRLVPAGTARSIAGAAAALSVALYGPLVRLESNIVVDFFVVLFQSWMLWALIRWTQALPRHQTRWLLLSGALAAAAWLTRPTLTPLLPVLALWVVLRTGQAAGPANPSLRRRILGAAVFLSIPLVVMAAVYLRNARTGDPMLLPWQGGFNFYHANRTGALGRYFLQTQVASSSGANPTRRLAEEGWLRSVSPGEAAANPRRYSAINRYWFDLARRDISGDPLRWAGLMGRKLLYVVSDKEIFNFEEYDLQRSLSSVLPWLFFRFGIVAPLALASLAMLPFVARRRWPGWELLWIYGAGFAFATALYYTSGRMRMPLLFPAVVLGSSGLALAVARLATPGRPRLALYACYLLLLTAGAVLSWGDWWGVRSERMWHADLSRMSNAAWREGRARLALELAERAALEKPDYPTLPTLRGQALYSLGRKEEAAAAYREAVRRIPGDPVAPFNLAVALHYDLGRPEEAAALYAESLRRDPAYHQAAWRSALLHLKLGQPEKARGLLQPYESALAAAGRQGARPPSLLLVAATALACTEGNRERAAAFAGLLSTASAKAQLQEELQLLGLGECAP